MIEEIYYIIKKITFTSIPISPKFISSGHATDLNSRLEDWARSKRGYLPEIHS